MNGYSITQFGYKQKPINIQHSGGFVRLEHLESKIVVTKYNKIQAIALNNAKDEIEQLVKIWENL